MVSDSPAGSSHQAFGNEEVDEDADAVAAHFREGAVAVAVVHEPLGVRVRCQQFAAFRKVAGRARRGSGRRRRFRGGGRRVPRPAPGAIGQVRRRGQRSARNRCPCRGPWRTSGRSGLECRRSVRSAAAAGFRPWSKVTVPRVDRPENRAHGGTARAGSAGSAADGCGFGHQVRVLPVEPGDAGIGPEPGELPAGELPGGHDGFLRGLRRRPIHRRVP